MHFWGTVKNKCPQFFISCCLQVRYKKLSLHFTKTLLPVFDNSPVSPTTNSMYFCPVTAALLPLLPPAQDSLQCLIFHIMVPLQLSFKAPNRCKSDGVRSGQKGEWGHTAPMVHTLLCRLTNASDIFLARWTRQKRAFINLKCFYIVVRDHCCSPRQEVERIPGFSTQRAVATIFPANSTLLNLLLLREWAGRA